MPPMKVFSTITLSAIITAALLLGLARAPIGHGLSTWLEAAAYAVTHEPVAPQLARAEHEMRHPELAPMFRQLVFQHLVENARQARWDAVTSLDPRGSYGPPPLPASFIDGFEPSGISVVRAPGAGFIDGDSVSRANAAEANRLGFFSTLACFLLAAAWVMLRRR